MIMAEVTGYRLHAYEDNDGTVLNCLVKDLPDGKLASIMDEKGGMPKHTDPHVVVAVSSADLGVFLYGLALNDIGEISRKESELLCRLAELEEMQCSTLH